MNPFQSFLSRFAGHGEEASSGNLKSFVQAWNKHAAPSAQQPHFHTRYLVLGFHPMQEAEDGVLSVSALGVEKSRISPDDAAIFRLPLAPEEAEDEIRALLAFCGDSIWVAFRTDYGVSNLIGQISTQSGVGPEPFILDLSILLSELFPEAQGRCHSIADWLHFFELEDDRLDAITDAFAIARLLQYVLVQASERGIATPADLQRVEKARRWLWAH